MKYIKLFESKSLENKFLDITKEIIDLILDVVEGYEDDGRVENVDIAVSAIWTSAVLHQGEVPILCCSFNSDGSHEFNENGLRFFEMGNPIEYSMNFSTHFRDLSEMYEELTSKISSLYDIKYSKIYYLDHLSNNWKSVNPEADVVTIEDLIGFDRVFIHERPFDIRFRIEK